jgi:two-component system invasion response regulator UvrY
MIEVLLVDDHILVRTAIELMLNADSEISVVGNACTGEEALEWLENASQVPQVVVMDIHMPGMGGVEASKRILKRYPNMKVIILTMHDEVPLPQQLLHLGVQGFLSKSCAAAEMVSAIKSVYQGKRYLSNDVANHIALSATMGEASPFEQLSQREMEIVMLTLQGATIPDMAQALMISPKTINTYRYRVHEKLRVRNDVELTRLARRYQLIEDPTDFLVNPESSSPPAKPRKKRHAQPLTDVAGLGSDNLPGPDPEQ